MGTLGVEGAANLFLLNPNGIIFGPNAQLDIRGSFLATTAHNFTFPDGSEFSAVAPQAPPLLTLNVPIGLQYGSHPAGTITNQGNLAVGQDLTLAAHTLDVQGQLQAGRNLTLHAQDTLQVRDSVMHPFLATAGNQMLLQGDRTVEIATLNHPDSRFSAGTDLVLRSANPITGNAHFHAGRDVRIEQLDSSWGNLFSPQHALMRAGGDVRLHSYNGASLHILAGGSVAIAGEMTMTAADATGHAPVEQVVLSDGSRVAIDGTRRPTLDIRAGTTAVGTAGSRGDNSAANITVGGTIRNPGGDVLLTNQYQARGQTRGAIAPGRITTHHIDTSTTRPETNGGSITLDAQNGIQTNDLDSSARLSVTTGSAIAGNGGAIHLLTAGGGISSGRLNSSSSIFLESATVSGSSFTTGDGGIINLYATNGDIHTEGLYSSSLSARFPDVDFYSISNTSFTTGDGGAIRLHAADGNIRAEDLNSSSSSGPSPFSATSQDFDSSFISNSSATTGNGGAISLNATNGDIRIEYLSSDSSADLLNFSSTSNSDFTAGNGGAISLNATNGDIRIEYLSSVSSSDFYSSSIFDSSAIAGNGGTISLDALNGDIRIENLSSGSSSGAEADSSGSGAEAELDSSSISHSDFTAGDGGAISLRTANGNIHIENLSSSSLAALTYFSSISHSSATARNGGVIGLFATNGDINAGTVSSSAHADVFDSSSISNSNFMAGNGGAISLRTANGDIRQGSVFSYASADLDSFSISNSSATAGNGGSIRFYVVNGDIRTEDFFLFLLLLLVCSQTLYLALLSLLEMEEQFVLLLPMETSA